jgi:pimeloyl-ACP methyl ester carboxylesterase
MPRLRSNGIELEYEERGNPSDPPLVLVMGLGAQMIHWPEGFCDRLADRGYRVIRFDNRDSGLSSGFEHLGDPNVGRALGRALVFGHQRVPAPYQIGDMARDLLGLLDGLGLDKAHVCGISMGGMIAQSAALRAPERLLSLTSLASTPGGRGYLPKARALKALLSKAEPTPEGAIERGLKIFDALRGPRFEFDADGCAKLAERAYHRANRPDGFARQFVAVCGSPSRRRALRQLRVPTLVMHGTADPLIPPAAGKATAEAIPGARLHMIEGMGHHLPSGAWSELVQVISEHAGAAEAHQDAVLSRVG